MDLNKMKDQELFLTTKHVCAIQIVKQIFIFRSG